MAGGIKIRKGSEAGFFKVVGMPCPSGGLFGQMGMGKTSHCAPPKQDYAVMLQFVINTGSLHH